MLIDKGLRISSVKRVFSYIRSIINLSISEEVINCINAFSKTYMPESKTLDVRKPIPINVIRQIQSLCKKYDDDLRWLIAFLSDTGMRLGECISLLKSEIRIDYDFPHVKVKPHAWRRLKTKGSESCIPLVKESLWACKKILEHNNNIFAFPRYAFVNHCHSNSASAALNKWLKEQLIEGYVIHSLRHGFRDKLRAVECPAEIIDQLGGLSLRSVRQGYGNGYDLSILSKWLLKI